MLNCKEAIRLASEDMDHRLPWMKRFSLKLHLTMCKFCSMYVRQLQYLRRIFRLSHEEPFDSIGSSLFKLPDEAKARIKQRLRQK